jgi:hypothetical protein
MENARDGRNSWAWANTSLDDVTAAFEEGFIFECAEAGEERCALAVGGLPAVNISESLHRLFESTKLRPIPGVSRQGPGIVTFEGLTEWLYATLYRPNTWQEAATLLHQLGNGNATGILDKIYSTYTFDPEAVPRRLPHGDTYRNRTTSSELDHMVICVRTF